ncbi:hypothetical protein Pmani_007611 [Petrolisthes manimaculis]|uniref:Large ribosomal subunit protein uL3m n=1 Tax=Petrolisthes manimaculis TaxID=1843537 RepID=A0AAE1Q7Y4_9EUCA|nr:hypothetical protein Pmani_007611 [Petrolisthes manimaculis]
MSLLSVTRSILYGGKNNLQKIEVINLLLQQNTSVLTGGTGGGATTRNMSRMKKTRPFWQPKSTRTLYPEELTPSNEAFGSEVISDQHTSSSTTSPLKCEPWPRGVWSEASMRCGVIARKIGVYPMWDNNGRRLLTTLLEVPDNEVVKYIPPEKLLEHTHPKKNNNTHTKEMAALVVGADPIDPRLVTKEYYGVFADSGLLPKKKLTKFLITPDAKLPPGTPLYASHYRPGQYVDVLGTTIDRGFQGVMKRWLFKGMPATHGVTKSHRRPGNIGSGGEKARVLPGQKMPGHMGNKKRILRGLKIWRVNTKYNVMWVQGPAIPGATGSYVYVYDSWYHHCRHTPDNPPPFPTFFQDEEEGVEEEMYHPDLHVFSKPSIAFNEK